MSVEQREHVPRTRNPYDLAKQITSHLANSIPSMGQNSELFAAYLTKISELFAHTTGAVQSPHSRAFQFSLPPQKDAATYLHAWRSSRGGSEQLGVRRMSLTSSGTLHHSHIDLTAHQTRATMHLWEQVYPSVPPREATKAIQLFSRGEKTRQDLYAQLYRMETKRSVSFANITNEPITFSTVRAGRLIPISRAFSQPDQLQ